MKKTVNFPWYIFLLPVFFVLHANNTYFWLIPLAVSLSYLYSYLLLALVCFGMGFLLLRNKIKAGIWAISFLIIFFFFGSFYDFLRDLHTPLLLLSYTFLLLSILAIMIIISFFLRKRKSPTKLHRFFLLLFTLMTISEIVIWGWYWTSDKKKAQNYGGDNKPLSINLTESAQAQSPDIFFMVFDEYASSAALKKYDHFDNAQLDSTLLNNGFFISTRSKSNYNSTPLSVGSCFNMDYFQRPMEHTQVSLLQGAYAVRESLLPKLLEKHGYEIINYGIFSLKDHPTSVKPLFREYAIPFYLETLWGRIGRDILWNATTRLPGDRNRNPTSKTEIDGNLKNYNGFIRELRKESDKPRFVMGHLLLPHAPANVDRYGKARLVKFGDFNDSLYLDQLRYANTLIDSLAHTAVKKQGRPFVLIIEGDHGHRDKAGEIKIREKQLMNLNSYYFSDRNYSGLYDSISPVNSFRIVLDKYFKAGLPTLKDSSVLLY